MARLGPFLFAALLFSAFALAAQSGGSGSGGSSSATSSSTGSATAATADRDGDGTPDAKDCAPTDATRHPGASEVCNSKDDDCDSSIDEADATDAKTWYQDKDLDKVGNAAVTRTACRAPTGFVATSGDCNDARSNAKPGGTEVCDGIDNDCDGTTDEDDAANAKTWYKDGDSDGFGDKDATMRGCAMPSGYLAAAGDCDDSASSVNPKVTETCNGKDDDCDGKTDEPDASGASAFYKDSDGDGFGNKLSPTRACAAPSGYVADATDCNDAAGAAKPGGAEVCDGLDNDCDGTKDEADASDARTWYQDKDLDKAGNAAISKVACYAPAGFIADSGDCDDARSTAKPGGTELCDGIDNDCDGSTDEDDAANAKTWYKDGDSDGFGDKGATARACSVPTGYLAAAGDCDDSASGVNPKATESCNGKDDDCDGKTDEPDASDASAFYKDSDGDGFGNKLSPTRACSAPGGYVADATDCNDAASAAKPGATEVCDGVDNDCDGAKDEADASDAKTWYQDKDLDRAGNAAVSKVACYAPAGFIADSGDCDDARSNAKPGGTEVCDGIDNDCDGSADEDDATNAKTWYKDGDSDGFGDKGATTRACNLPTGYLAAAGDCDDSAGSVNPKAAETCNGKDDDCDGKTDEPDATDASAWYRDGDGDSFGNKLSATRACSAPSGYVADATDCNDASSSASPNGKEMCDGLDNDCDGSKDEPDAADAKTWYQDKDLDRYGDAGSSKPACYAPAGFVSNSDDCDDSKGTIKPGGTELCDGADNDCDGSTDEPDAANAKTWYKDGDSDSFGARGETTRACTVPGGYVADARDCDDSAGSVNPSATETCDGVDDDCDGKTDEPDASDAKTWYADSDADQYGDAKATTRACTQPRGYVGDSSDCNPRLGSANPGADERCNGVDDDCDGSTDEDQAVDAKTWYRDSDADRFGSSSDTTKACKVPAGFVGDSSDCDDSSNQARPGGLEVCDSLDNDCDGTTDEDDARGAPTWYKDSDSDGFGDRSAPKVACKAPSGFTDDATDCDDTLSVTYPGAPESCDGRDNDCNVGNEAGIVTFLGTGGGREDLTQTFKVGGPGKPVSWRASRAGTLTFCDGTYYANLDLKVAGVTVQSLNGRDATTLDGGGAGTVISASADATVRGLTVRDGKNGDSGGGVLVTGGNVTVQDSRIADNEATSFGGGLYAQRGTLRVVNSTVVNNKAHSGGGVYGYYAAMALEGSTVTGNTAVDGAGLYARFSSLDLSGGQVTSNQASSQGGGVQLYGGATFTCRGQASIRDNAAERGQVMHVAEKSEVRSETCDVGGGDVFVDGGGGVFRFDGGAGFTCKVPDGCKGN